MTLHKQHSKTLSGHVSLTRGYKSGGLNLGGLGERVKPQFNPEIADSLQLGLSKVENQGRDLYSITLYNTRVKDFQVPTYDEHTGLVPNPWQNNVINITNVRLEGI